MTGFVGGWDKDKYLYYSIATGQVIVFDKEIWEDIENEDVNDEVTQAFRDFAFKSNYVDNGKQMKLVILPTEECNFRCSYCYESFKEGKMDEDIQDRIVRYVENNVQNYNSLYVGWFGGEPLEALDVIESLSIRLIKICKDKKIGYCAGITTNGYNLTLDVFKRLKTVKVYNFQVTLDGLKKEHNEQKKHKSGSTDTFSKIVDNIRMIRENVKSGAFRLTIRTNYTRNIADNVDEYFDFLEDLIGNDKRFGVFWRLAGDWGNIKDESIKEKFCNVEDYVNILKKSQERNFNMYILRYMLREGGYACYASNPNSIVLKPNGEVLKCTCHLDDDINKIGILDSDGRLMVDYEKIKYWEKHATVCRNTNCKTYAICRGKYCPYPSETEEGRRCPMDLINLVSILKIFAKDKERTVYIESKDDLNNYIKGKRK
jgi:uncharacterized protein